MVRVVYKDRRSSTRGSVGDNVRLRMGGTRKANFCSDGQFLFAAMAVPVLRAAASVLPKRDAHWRPKETE
jgi:hypothetical protein